MSTQFICHKKLSCLCLVLIPTGGLWEGGTPRFLSLILCPHHLKDFPCFNTNVNVNILYDPVFKLINFAGLDGHEICITVWSSERITIFCLWHKCEHMVSSEWNLKGQCHEKVFKLTLWEFRLGPTDRPHPLLTSVNLLGSFKDDVRRSKTYFIIV